MSLENFDFGKETTGKDIVALVREEISAYSLPQAVRLTMFSRPEGPTPEQASFKGDKDGTPWLSTTEIWDGGERIVVVYPWSLSVRRRDGESMKYLTRRNEELIFSGKMPILDFNKMLKGIISEKGSGFSPIKADAVAKELAEDIAVNQESVDFPQINVSFEFKFLKSGYKVLKAEVL